jgi:hypothetical protein
MLRHYSGIFLEGEENHKTIGEDNQFQHRDLKTGPQKYETEVLTTRL